MKIDIAVGRRIVAYLPSSGVLAAYKDGSRKPVVCWVALDNQEVIGLVVAGDGQLRDPHRGSWGSGFEGFEAAGYPL